MVFGIEDNFVSFGEFTDEHIQLHSNPFDTTALNGAGLRAFINLKSALIALERAKAQAVGLAKNTFAASERSAEAQQTFQATGMMASMKPADGQREVHALYTKKATMQARSRTMTSASDAPRVARVIEDASRLADEAVRTVAAAYGMHSGLRPKGDTVPGITDGAFLGVPGVNIVTKVRLPNAPFVPPDSGLAPMPLDMPYALGPGTDPYLPHSQTGKFLMDPYQMEPQNELQKPHYAEPLGGPNDIMEGLAMKLQHPNRPIPYTPAPGDYEDPGAFAEGDPEHPAGEPEPENQEAQPEPGTIPKEDPEADSTEKEEPAPDKNPEGEDDVNEHMEEKEGQATPAKA